MTTPQQRSGNISFGQLDISKIDPEQLNALKKVNFALWATSSGIEVDNKSFDTENHKYLIPLYMDESDKIVWMKAAQMGATIWMLLRLLHFTLNNVAKACLYFPTLEAVSKLSKDRLTPLIHSNAELSKAVEDTDTIGYKRIGRKSSLYLQHMGGEATKDSTPFDMICFDEVRLLNAADIDQARERISHSTFKREMLVSTAGYPGCFAGSTMVVVKEKTTGKVLSRSIKDLEDCYTEYQALSYNRRGGNRLRWRNIKEASCTGIRSVVKVTLWGGYEIICTPDHPFAVVAKANKGQTIKWSEIAEVPKYPKRFGGKIGPKEGVLRALTIPEHSNGKWSQSITEAPFDRLTLAVLGCYISEGSIKDKEVSIWQTKPTKIKECMAKWADLNGLPYRHNVEGIHISLAKRPDLLLMFQECGIGESSKVIHPEVLKGTKDQLDTVIHWIIEGDGNRRKPRTSSHESFKEFEIFTSSKKLASQLLFVGLKIQKPLSISIREPRTTIYKDQKIIGKHKQYQLCYNPRSFQCQEVISELGQVAVGSVEHLGQSEVYDLQIEGYPAFVLAESGCLVHNTDIHRDFLGGTQNYWHVKCGCWTPDEKIIVRKKGSTKPVAISFLDLAIMGLFGVQQYQALSWNSRRSKWQYRDITKLHDNGIKKVKKLVLKNGAIAIGTGDHRMFVPDDSGKGPSYLGERTLGSVLDGDQLTAIEAIPDVGEAKSRTGSKVIPEHVLWDQETLYVTGAFVAEGSWKDWGKKQWINIAQIEGKEIRHRVSQWAKDNLIPIKARKSGLDLGIGCRLDLVQWFAACGRGCENKRFPKEVLNAPVAQLQAAVDGYLDGDAHRPRNKRAEVWAASTTSELLAKQFRWVGLRLGLPLSIKPQKVKKGRKPSWSIRYTTNSLHTKAGPRLGLASTKVSRTENAGSDQVFDITVEGNHNYVLANSGLLVHNCSDGFVPSDCWPDCVAVTKKEIYLRCPKCGMRIMDSQNGHYIAHKPNASYPSYHISQLISKYISIAQIWDAWQRTQNIKEFFNAKLGKPYVDEENQPIKDDDLATCENTDLLWGMSKTKYGGKIQRAMGIDQMGGDNYAIICERHENKKRIVHYEIIDNRNPLYLEAGNRVSPFKRCYQLMREFDIDLCVVDAMPNINEAIEFAMEFKKRVFVAHYIEAQRDMVQWGDRPKEKMTVKRGGPRIKFKYTCLLSRYLSIDFALSEVANRNMEWPHPRKLVQICRSMDSGLYEPLHIFETHFYKHLKSIVRQKTVLDDDTGRFKMEWVNLGIDPHSVHAWNLCNIALERLAKVPFFTMM